MSRPTPPEIEALLLADGAALFAGDLVCVRLLGLGFAELRGELLPDSAQPYDAILGKRMTETAARLLDARTELSLAFIEREQISLLASCKGEPCAAGRLGAILCVEASACLSALLGQPTCFDTRLYAISSPAAALGFFRWRQEEVAADTLDAYCELALVASGSDRAMARKIMARISTEAKVELLRDNGVQFLDLPGWQRRGVACYRRLPGAAQPAGDGDPGARLMIDTRLPAGEEYVDYLRRVLG
jgi:tRNA(His) 5'-end guanylyltransferase